MHPAQHDPNGMLPDESEEEALPSPQAATDDGDTLARDELYRLIWKEPMTKVAPRYGLSDVGLAKVCRKHNIPRPPVGYWARLAVGQKVRRTPLPKLDDEALNEIRLFRQQFAGVKDKDHVLEKPVVAVGERLIKPHPLIASAKDLIGADAASTSKHECLDVQVAPSSLPRALRILDALIKKWEELGGEVWIDRGPDEKSKTRFGINKDSVAVSMAEEWELVDDHAHERRNWRAPKYVHTGHLVLEVSGRWADNYRRRWADRKKQRLEDVLGSFIVGLNKWIAHQAECRLDSECEARQREQVEKVRIERQQRHERLEQRRKDLEGCAENWRKSQEIRSYIVALESAIESGKVRANDPANFPEWLTWAKWYAEALDPLAPTPPRAEYARTPSNLPSQELDLTRRAREIVQTLGIVDAEQLFGVSRQAVLAACSRYGWSVWSEIGRVLEGLGFDVSKRARHY